jgi:hypothetical protein
LNLYDLLSNDINGNIDSEEQTILFDSFPWNIKQVFKKAMKNTINYTNELSNFDMSKIPLEQQICLLKAKDDVKEKAMLKLKEVKAKSEDSGSKARQYLDGLLKIPFSIFKKEPILHLMETIKSQFKNLYEKHKTSVYFPEITKKDKYTNLEIVKYISLIKSKQHDDLVESNFDELKKILSVGNKQTIISNIVTLNKILDNQNLSDYKLNYTSKNKLQIKEHANNFINTIKTVKNNSLLFI